MNSLQRDCPNRLPPLISKLNVQKQKRRGMSVLEIVIASVILLLVSMGLMRALGGLRTGLQFSKKRMIALYIGQAILENIRYRLYTFGPSVPPDESNIAERDRKVKAFFDALAQKSAKVATNDDGLRSQYFFRCENLDGSGIHGISSNTHPRLYRYLSDYGCEVEVLSGPATDSDDDGIPENDLRELKVRTFWTEGPQHHQRSHTLWTIITSRRHRSAP